MAKAKVQPTPKPLAELEAALSKTSNDELLEFSLAILEDGAARAENYVDAIAEAPADTLNEGLAFVRRFNDIHPGFFADTRRAREAHRRLSAAETALTTAWGQS